MENRPTFLSPHRPWPVRCYNRAAVELNKRGIVPHRLRTNAVLRMARLIARRVDFGSETFREPLDHLLRSFAQNAQLHPFGRTVVFYYLADLLANRLKVQADLQRYPQILDSHIRRPLFVLGLPRTGTTLLYNLLSQDPGCRPLMAWESRYPSPPPQDDKREGDPRIWRSRMAVGFQDWLAPELQSIHPMAADGPEECIFLTMNTMLSPGFMMLARLGDYDRWLRDLTFEERLPSYQDYRRQLQLLQWRCPGKHWVLKSPVHLASLDTLFDVFPDACVVQTHRDPARVVPSLSSMFAVIRGMLSDEVDLHDLGEEVLDSCRFLVERAAMMRETLPDRVLDLQFKDLVSDPIGTVGRIYDHFGYARSTAMDARMAAWMSANPRHAAGVHRYDLAQFGIDDARIDRVFGAYRDRYAIG